MTIYAAPSVSLRAHNTLAIDARARYFIDITEDRQVPEAIAYARQQQLPFMVLGEGSNVVLSEHYPGVVLHMATRGIQFTTAGATVYVDVAAGENWHQLVIRTLQRGYYGLENLALIPGTAGAAPIQNIGAYGVELSEVLDSVSGWHCQQSQWQTLDVDACEFGYRDSIFKHALRDGFVITALRLKLSTRPAPRVQYDALQRYFEHSGGAPDSPRAVAEAVMAIRRAKLPDTATLPNAGSFFKNPLVTLEHYRQLRRTYPELVAYPVDDHHVKLAAGWLIERAGWKGKMHGAVGMHAEQALVLVNPGAGSGAEVLALANAVRDDVRTRFGVELEIEPRVY